MTRETWDQLRLGDVLRNVATGQHYTVGDYQMFNGKRVVVLVTTVIAHTPDEWTQVRESVDSV